MPPLEKNTIDICLEKIKKSYTDFPVFVESGTFMTETTHIVADLFEKVYTIELEPGLYERAVSIFKENPAVDVIFGDTLKILPTILESETRNSIFWLDGHNSGPGTAVGEVDFPALEECEIIDNQYKGEFALVLIDDVRLFGVGHSDEIDDSLVTITVDKIINTFKNKKVIDYWLLPSWLSENDRLVIYIN